MMTFPIYAKIKKNMFQTTNQITKIEIIAWCPNTFDLPGLRFQIPEMANCYITNWKDPPCLMGKSTISMAIFNSKLLT